MADTDIPPAAEALLREHVHTFEELEVLVMLYRARPAAHDAEAIAAALKAPVEATREALAGLTARGLAAAADAARQYRYAADSHHDAAVAALDRAYEENRLAIMRRMSENAIGRMRTGAMRAFADAFVIGRKPDG